MPSLRSAKRLRLLLLLMLQPLGCVHGAADGGDDETLLDSASAPLSWTGVVGRITGTGTTVALPLAGGGTYTHDLVEAGQKYDIVEAGPARVPLTGWEPLNERHRRPKGMVFQERDESQEDVCIHGDSCLSFTGYAFPPPTCPRPVAPSTDCSEYWGNDRIEVNLSRADDGNAMQLGQWRYLRLYVKVDPETQPQTKHTLISQVWQSHTHQANARQPPFSIKLSNGESPGTWDLNFLYLNDEQATSRSFHTETIDGDRWYNIHVAMKAGPVGGPRGAILVWMNQGLQFAFDPSVPPVNPMQQFHWGYAPLNLDQNGECPKVLVDGVWKTDLKKDCVRPVFDVRVGLYRAVNDLRGWPLTSLKMDSLKLTTTSANMPGL